MRDITTFMKDRIDRLGFLIVRFYARLRYRGLTAHVISTAGYDIPAEIEYRDKKGRVVGFWAYGYWHPKYPYRG